MGIKSKEGKVEVLQDLLRNLTQEKSLLESTIERLQEESSEDSQKSLKSLKKQLTVITESQKKLTIQFQEFNQSYDVNKTRNTPNEVVLDDLENSLPKMLIAPYKQTVNDILDSSVSSAKMDTPVQDNLSNNDEAIYKSVEKIVSADNISNSEDKVSKELARIGINKRVSLKEEYKKALTRFDYFYAFELLSTRMNSDDEQNIGFNKQELEDFFADYKGFLKIGADMGVLHKFAMCLADFLSTQRLSPEEKEYLQYVFPIGAMSLCFSVLVGGNALTKAKVLKPYINNNLNAYPNVIKDLIAQNKVEALDFLLENTVNHEFNNYEIMNSLMGLPSYEKVYYFYEKYEFSINAKLAASHHNLKISAPEWNTLFSRIVDSKNFALFEEIMSNSKQRPALNVIFNVDGVIKNYSVFYLIKGSSDLNRYLEKALDYPDIRSDEINSILSMLMQNMQLLIDSINNNIVKKIFEHPNLNSVSFVEDTVHLFGFLSCVSYWAKFPISDYNYDAMGYVLERFFERFPDVNTIPIGTNVNLVGSTVFLLDKVAPIPRLQEILMKILVHYIDWINVENPCGKTPLELVSQNNKKLYDRLIGLGAVERRRSTWDMLKFWDKSSVSNVDFSQRLSLNGGTTKYKAPNNQTQELTRYSASLDVEKEMRESFIALRPSLKNMPLDIRLACEDMFLSAENLLILTKQEDKGKFNEDVFFLVQTFNDYLPSIINTYIGSADLDFIKNGVLSKDTPEKEEVLKQIQMLNNHISKMRNNIELKMKKKLNMDIGRNTEFLKQKLGVADENTAEAVDNIDMLIKRETDNDK